MTEIDIETKCYEIIIVDDDRDFSLGLSDLLSLEGFNVQLTNNPDSAIETLKHFPAKVALIDLHLGRSNGIDLVSYIEKNHPHTLTVLMTAQAELETAVDALRQGAYDYLRKPFHADDLLVTLKRCLEHFEATDKAEGLLKAANEYAKETQEINEQLKKEIAQRVKLEADLVSLNQTLDNKVKERTAELNELNEKIGTIARQAGMAEVASGMLHNVGNVLNSVNVSAVLINELRKKSKSKKLKPVVELLKQHQDDIADYLSSDEQGKNIPEFLAALSDELTREDERMSVELQDLMNNINHVKNIIHTQQSYTGNYGVMEKVKISELVDDALKINAQGMSQNNIEVVKEYEAIPLLNIDKHKYLQIIINLLSNAKFSLIESAKENKKIVISIRVENDQLFIEVKDNGLGICKEDINKLFEFGFTKRKGGHGNGLHNCSIVANTLKGRISVYSDGLGKGARFVFVSPLSL